jgi:hypothetical protein
MNIHIIGGNLGASVATGIAKFSSGHKVPLQDKHK